MLEKQLEAKIVKLAKSLSIHYEKITGIKGFPDRMFICRCSIFFIEFKRNKDSKLIVMQKRKIKKIRDRNKEVHVVNNIEDGLKMLEKHKECWRL